MMVGADQKEEFEVLKARAVYGDSLLSDYQDASYANAVPSYAYGYSAPAIGGYGYSTSTTTPIEAMLFILMIVMIPCLFCAICAMTNIAVGAFCFFFGKRASTKKDGVLAELEV